jgi:hypothetical protein
MRVILTLVTVLLAGVASAQSTTIVNFDDCADWNQMGDPCGPGDVVTGYGDWITPDGQRDQILEAAGFSGKGFRHHRSAAIDGVNRNGGGILITLPTSARQMMRWRQRNGGGLAYTGGAPQYTKDIMHVRENTGQGDLIIGVSYGSFYAYVERHGVGDDANVRSSVNWRSQATGWHCYAVSVDASTGRLQLYFDGALVLNRRVRLERTSFSSIVVGENQRHVSTTGWTDYDDFVIGSDVTIDPDCNQPVP